MKDRKFFTIFLVYLAVVSLVGATNINVSKLRFFNASGGFVGLQAPAGLNSGTIELTWPSADGQDGQALKTDGSGNLTFGPVDVGGSVTYFEDFEADSDSNVAPYDDVSEATDLTGGSPNVTKNSETSAPLSETASYKLLKDAADRQHEGWSIASQTLGRMETTGPKSIWISFAYETSADYVSGDVQIFTYRVGSNTLEACNTIEASNDLPAAPDGGTYTCF